MTFSEADLKDSLVTEFRPVLKLFLKNDKAEFKVCFKAYTTYMYGHTKDKIKRQVSR
jgi:hypothetical protein